MTFTARRATDADLNTVVELWTQAAAWLRERGEDQWQYPIKVDGIRAAISSGTCWLIDSSEQGTVATVTVDAFADPRLWQPSDQPDQALYVHRLVVRADARAQELGS